jgi:hypothetical protein
MTSAVVHRTWAEVVFHVLAHVAVDVPASAWEPRYVRFAEARLGPAQRRPLGEDARALAALLPDHDGLARAQLLAWLFGDLERAERVFDRALDELAPEDVDEPTVLAHLRRAPASVRRGAELLFCAAALEASHVRSLGPVVVDGEALALATRALALVAPGLRGVSLGVVRALGWRGRALGGSIWVGAPGALGGGPSLEHVAWQAAHEAVVAEVFCAARAPHADAEHVAIVLLAERARRAGLEVAHARWLSSLRAPPPDRASLGPQGASLLAAVERSGT